MLQRLVISNYALIDRLDICFRSKMTTITGETGAGKSIILGALSLLLGKRADTSVLKDKNQKSIIEASFLLDNSLQSLFESLDIDFEKETIIRREITPQGKSRSFVNDTPVGLQALKDLGQVLIDIHSQHQNLFLKESSFQCQVIDAEADNNNILQIYQKEYHKLLSLKQQLKLFTDETQKQKDDLEYYKFRLNELLQAHINVGEFEQLEQESDLIENSEQIKTILNQSENILTNDNAVLAQVKYIVQNFEKNATVKQQFGDITNRLSQVYIELSDIADEISKKNSALDFNPERKEEIDNRLDLLNNLFHKYSAHSEQELKEKLTELEAIVDKLDNSDFKCEELQKACKEQEQIVKSHAEELHKRRDAAIKRLTPQIISLLQKLGMPSVSFNIKLTNTKDFNPTGTDEVSMEFSANKNIAPQWIGNISSGGELSRLMLCLKYCMAKNKSIPTIIFDEIDTGVSGEIADQTGNMMLAMANDMQVITITHLPQIAVKAQTQFRVYKTEDNNTTTSNITELSNEQRIEEIAKMLSGKTVTDAALKNARLLLGL